jgi:ankyrin repeat protein
MRVIPFTVRERPRSGLPPASGVLAVAVVLAILAVRSGSGAEPARAMTPLQSAAYRGDAVAVERLLDAGATPDDGNDLGMTPLMYAAGATPVIDQRYAGSTAVVRTLLDRGAALNAKTGNGYTALHFSAMHGNEATVRLLVERGADVDARTDHDDSALSEAVGRGFDDVVWFLLEHGASTNPREPGTDQAPLLDAISQLPRANRSSSPEGRLDCLFRDPGEAKRKLDERERRSSIVVMMLDHGANVNVSGQQGQTPLMMATAANDRWLVRALLDRGANPNVKARAMADGTALILAAQWADPSIVRALLDRGAASDPRDSFGKTATDYATELGRDDVLEILAECCKG